MSSRPPLAPGTKLIDFKHKKLVVVSSITSNNSVHSNDSSGSSQKSKRLWDKQDKVLRSSSAPERIKDATTTPASLFPPLPPGPLPVGNCMLRQHCFSSKQPLRDRCPGCSNLLHAACSHVLDAMEGLIVDGQMKWFPSGSVICFASDPETNGLNHTIAEKVVHPRQMMTWKKRRCYYISHWSPCFGK
jgi:hypothetical protein